MGSVQTLMNKRSELLRRQKKIYITAVNQLNSEYRNVLNFNFGNEMIECCKRDFSGEIVRRYLCPGMGKMYITADQLAKRISTFSYENDYDPLSKNEEYTKSVYNYFEGPNSPDLNEIMGYLGEKQKKLFIKEKLPSGKPRYVDDGLFQNSKHKYKKDLIEKDSENKLRGTYTGQEVKENKTKTGRKNPDHQVDHVEPRASITYEDFLDKATIQELKELYNSPANYAMLGSAANNAKGDTRVFMERKTGKVVYAKTEKEKNTMQQQKTAYDDITYKATPEQKVQAEVSLMENASPEQIEKMKNEGMLDNNGKVPKSVKKGMLKKKYEIDNKVSMVKLKSKSVQKEAVDTAVKNTTKNFKKIVVGQMLYYMVPPIVYETRVILKTETNTDRLIERLKKAGKRIVDYTKSKMGYIIKNLISNTAKEFLKNFFDFLIEIVKATVKRLMKVVKSLALSVIDAIRIIADKKSTSTQKADAVFNLMAVTITSCLVEILGEYIETTLGIPNIISEPLQMIATIICTNAVMLILQSADIFNVRHGIKLAKIKKIFEEAEYKYYIENEEIVRNYKEESDEIMEDIKADVREIEDSLETINLFEQDATETLKLANEVFNMGIDFESEWKQYLAIE